ncbi:MAG: zinc-binding alcohol dehydrogenase [Phycisphaerales bacterium]|jgi:3-hydroxyethyl bacteriochlorophyllide a dehydrogenase|nr:zinc-binding alcohol dehydrogenase [Phycisphaerales bacterium]
MKTQAIVFDSPSQVSVHQIELPPITENEVLVQTHFSTVSPGTELRTLAGKEPSADPFPLVPGYSTVGEVVDVGAKVKGLKIGTMAYVRGCRSLKPGLGCSWGGHAGHLIAPQQEVFVLPDKADPKKGTLTALLATALHGTDLTHARIREQVAVVGLGLVGQLCSRLLRLAGANVVATDLVPLRRQIAQQAGVTVVHDEKNLRKAFDAHFPYGAEAVVDAAGSSKALKASLSLLRQRPREDPCGSHDSAADGAEIGILSRLRKESHLHNGWSGPRLVAQGSYGDPIQIDYHDLFDSEVKFIVPRVHELKDIFRALELLVEPSLSLDGLISETHPIADAPRCYQKLKEHPGELITLCFDWGR